MKRDIRGWIAESLRFSSVVLVYYLLSLVNPIDLGFQQKIVESLLEAFIAGIVVAIVVDLAMGRPTIVLNFRHHPTGESMTGRPVLERKQVVNLQVRVEGGSLRHSIQKWRVARGGECTLHVDLRPKTSVLLQVQTTGAHTTAANRNQGSGVALQNLSLDDGAATSVNLSLRRRDTSPISDDIEIDVHECWNGRRRPTPLRMLKVSISVDGFVMRGR